MVLRSKWLPNIFLYLWYLQRKKRKSFPSNFSILYHWCNNKTTMFTCKHYCIVMCFLERSYGYMVSLLWYSPTSLKYIRRDPCNGENSHLLGVSRESYTRFSVLSFFNESVFPRSMTIPLGPFQFFSKIAGIFVN